MCRLKCVICSMMSPNYSHYYESTATAFHRPVPCRCYKQTMPQTGWWTLQVSYNSSVLDLVWWTLTWLNVNSSLAVNHYWMVLIKWIYVFVKCRSVIASEMLTVTDYRGHHETLLHCTCKILLPRIIWADSALNCPSTLWCCQLAIKWASCIAKIDCSNY